MNIFIFYVINTICTLLFKITIISFPRKSRNKSSPIVHFSHQFLMLLHFFFLYIPTMYIHYICTCNTFYHFLHIPAIEFYHTIKCHIISFLHISTNWWPIYSGLPWRPIISLDYVYELLILNLLAVSVMILFVLQVIVFNQHILHSLTLLLYFPFISVIVCCCFEWKPICAGFYCLFVYVLLLLLQIKLSRRGGLGSH